MIKERIIKVIEYKGIAKENFYKKIGITSANFRGESKKRPLNSNAIENILTAIPDLNPEWLLTGKGSMLKAAGTDLSPPDGSSVPVQQLQEENNRLKEKIGLQQEIIELLKDKLAMHEEKYKDKQEKKAS